MLRQVGFPRVHDRVHRFGHGHVLVVLGQAVRVTAQVRCAPVRTTVIVMISRMIIGWVVDRRRWRLVALRRLIRPLTVRMRLRWRAERIIAMLPFLYKPRRAD